MKLKKGDKVSSTEHPEIKSRIKDIKLSKWTGETLYYLENGCIYTRDEIIKI